MDKEEFEKEKKKIQEERTALYEAIEKKEVGLKEAEKRVAELKQRQKKLEQEQARANTPDNTEKRGALDFENVRNAMVEKRAITIGHDLGGQNFVKTILKEMQAKVPLLSQVTTYVGAHARTTVPVFMPGLAEPAGTSEGAKSIASDSQAKLKSVDLLPEPFVSTLPVSYNAIKFDQVGFAQELPKIFAEAFAQSFHKQIFSGSGSKQFKGFKNHTFGEEKKVTAKTASKLTVNDLAELALTVSDKTDAGCILLHPSVYSKILTDSPEKDLSASYIESLVRDKSIEGVKIILTSHMLKETAASSVVAIAGEMSKYGIAIAGDVDITPKLTVGDINVYFEAVMYANGQPLIDDFYALIAK